MAPMHLRAAGQRALLTLFVVSPLARDGSRRASSLCMASGSSAYQPAWASQIDESIRKNDVAHKNFVQLATVTADGLPAVRTVVFRGWMQNPIRDDDEGAGTPDDPIDVDVHLKFITDLRSSKMGESKVAEACWYFTETREQFRLRGELIMVTHESTDTRLIRQRTGLWKSISDAARAQFSWPTPGSDRLPEANDEKDFRCPADINAVSDNFVLMLLRPNYIDHLRLKGFPQKRVLWRRGDTNSWDAQPVNP